MYFTTSHKTTLSEFIQIEVKERRNYTMSEIKNIIKLYNLNLESLVIWVALEPYIAARYEMLAMHWDNAKEIYNKAPNDYNIRTIETGTLILETDDGDGGYLLILKD